MSKPTEADMRADEAHRPSKLRAAAALEGQESHTTGSDGSSSVQELDAQLPPSVRWLIRAATVLLPPAMLVALAYYFSVKRQETLALYFGIDASVLGYTQQDYLLRGGDALFLLLLFGALIGLAAVRGHAIVTRFAHNPDLKDLARRFIAAAGIVGAVLLTIGVVSVFQPLPFSPGSLFPPLSLGVGITLLGYATYLAGPRTEPNHEDPPGRVGGAWLRYLNVLLVALVVFLSVFWATKELAQALGQGQAVALAGNLNQRPGVVLYTTGDVGLSGPGVERIVMAGSADYRFRYEGLTLLVRSGGNYLLLPTKWTRTSGAVFVIKDDDRVRVEFTPHGGRR